MANPFRLAKVKQTVGSDRWGGWLDPGRRWAVVIPGEEGGHVWDVVADGFSREAQAKTFLAGLEMGWDWGARDRDLPT